MLKHLLAPYTQAFVRKASMSDQPISAPVIRKINRAYKYELDLNNEQRTACLRHAGAARWAYNYGLRRRKEAYRRGEQKPSAFDLGGEVVRLKATECRWLGEVSRAIPSYAFRDLDRAFKNFFEGRGLCIALTKSALNALQVGSMRCREDERKKSQSATEFESALRPNYDARCRGRQSAIGTRSSAAQSLPRRAVGGRSFFKGCSYATSSRVPLEGTATLPQQLEVRAGK